MNIKILIPNAPDKKNLGDQAIFEQLLRKLGSEKKNYRVVAHTFHPLRYRSVKGFVARPNVYYWAVFQKRDFLTRLRRFTALFLALLLPQPLDSLVSSDLEMILKDYQNADRIVMNGGGYFRSQSGFTQQLNALMNLMPLLFAKKYGKNTIIRPMSFGPFSNVLTEWICGKIVNLADSIHVRDEISYQLLSQYVPATKLERSVDEAFLMKPIKVRKPNKRTLGFTVREWVRNNERDLFIKRFVKLIEKTAKDHRCTVIQPIIQVDAPEYNEGDVEITNEIVERLESKGYSVNYSIKPRSVRQALSIYGKLSYLVGMRMHSCIFAHIQKVSFTAVSYEYKHTSLSDLGGKIIPVEMLVNNHKSPLLMSPNLKGAL